MNRSFSKIRHIQESNEKLEKRFLGEIKKEPEFDDDITSYDDDEFLSDNEPKIEDLEFGDMPIYSEDEFGVQDYGFDIEEPNEFEDDFQTKMSIKDKLKNFKPIDAAGMTKRWSSGDENYRPFNPIRSGDKSLDKLKYFEK